MPAMTETTVFKIHRALQAHFGELHWWPAENAFEVVVGALLTQNTAWRNVEKALENLRRDGSLAPASIARMPLDRLEGLLRPAGYFRQKALRLQALAHHLQTAWQGDIAAWCAGPLEEVRQRLMGHQGIGPETADTILLYAAERPSFVVDAYTRRIFTRLGLLQGDESYDGVRQLCMDNLPREVGVFNAYHAEIVHLAKDFCHKRQPLCRSCPLEKLCLFATQQDTAGP